MSIFNEIIRKDRCSNIRAGEEEGCVLRKQIRGNEWEVGRNVDRSSTRKQKVIELRVRVHFSLVTLSSLQVSL